MTSHLRHGTGDPAHHSLAPSSFRVADVEATSRVPITWMMPIVGISQRPTIQYTIVPQIHDGACEQAARGECRRHVTIEMLPEDTLLEIFDFYRLDAINRARNDGRPWKWHRLAHVCRRWRLVVYTSPRRLGLQILCKSGAPIEHILDSWPTLPLVVRFKGSPKSKFLPNNIVVALRHPDRVYEISIGVTSSIIGSLIGVVQEPFPALKKIEITSKNPTETPVLQVGEFLGGVAPLLEEILLNGIAVPFPVIRRLLLSTNNLVRLWLFKIPKTCYFSPEAIVTCLSALVRLKEVDIGFHFPASSPTLSRAPPPLERATLPSLLSLSFHGANEYLEQLVARIDSPALTTLSIKFFNQLIFEIPQLGQFISRVDELKSFNEVTMYPANKYGRISLIRREAHRRQRGQSYFHIPCCQLDWQLSFSTQIFNQLSSLLFGVPQLTIMKSYSPIEKEEVDPPQWLELFQLFSHVSKVRVDDEELVQGVVHALVSEDMAIEVLPNLTSLYLEGYRKSPSVMEAAERFVATRKLAGHNIVLGN